MWYLSDAEYVETVKKEVEDWDHHKKKIVVSMLCRLFGSWVFISLFQLNFIEWFDLNAADEINIIIVETGALTGFMLIQVVLQFFVFPCDLFNSMRTSDLLVQHFDANPHPLNKVGDKTGVGKNLITAHCSSAKLNDAEFVNQFRKYHRPLKIIRTCFYFIAVPLLIWICWIISKSISNLHMLFRDESIEFYLGITLGLLLGYLTATSLKQFMTKVIFALFACHRQERLLILHFDEYLSTSVERGENY